MSELNEHHFTVTVDIVQFDPESDRVVINGYLGDGLKVSLVDNRLELVGSEASLSVKIDDDTLSRIKSLRG